MTEHHDAPIGRRGMLSLACLTPSTKDSPWFVIPANHKWFRNLAVSQIIADTMEGLKMSYPKPTVDLPEIRRKYHAAEREAHDGGKRLANDAEKSK